MAYDYEAGYAQITERLKANAQEAINKIMPDVRRDWLKLIEENVKRIFTEAVDEFYGDYKPNVYGRNHSLYDLLKIELGNEYMEMWFDTSKMTPFRSGYSGENGLFDQVFMKGWHGGAASGDYSTFGSGYDDDEYGNNVVYTPHPSPGTPYWREPTPFYTRWGRAARIAPISPYENYTQKLEEYQTSQDGIYADYYQAWKQNESKLNYNL